MFEIYFNCINEHSFAEKRKSYRELESAIIFKLCRILVFAALTLGGIKSPPKVNSVNTLSSESVDVETLLNFH